MSAALLALALWSCQAAPPADTAASEAPCETLDWGGYSALPQTVHVSADASSGGDGSASAPLQTLGEALERTAGQDAPVIALWSGTYAGQPDIGPDHDGLTLIGQCAEEVILDVSGDEGSFGLDIDGASDITLIGLTLTGGPYAALVVEDASVEARDVRVVDNTYVGVFHISGPLSLSDSLIRDTWELDPETPGFGLISYGGPLTVTDSTIEGTRGVGVFLDASDTSLERVTLSDTAGVGVFAQRSALSLTDVSVLETTAFQDEWVSINLLAGVGIMALTSDLTADGLVVEGAELTGVSLRGGSSAVSGAEIRGTRLSSLDPASLPVGSSPYGGAYGVLDGGTHTLDHAVIEDNAGHGVWSTFYGDLTITDSVIRGNRPDPGYSAQIGGVLVDLRASLVIEDSEITDNLGPGAWMAGGALTLRRTLVARNPPEQPCLFEQGVGGVNVIGEDNTLVIEDSELADNLGFGLGMFADAPGPEATLERVTIRGTRPAVLLTRNDADGFVDVDGFGVFMVGQLTATDTDILDNGAGMWIDDGSALDLTDVTLSGTSRLGIYMEASALAVDGLEISDVSRTNLERAAVGLYALGRSTLSGSGLRVHDIDGLGVYLQGGVELTCEACELRDNRFAGLYLSGATARLSDSTVADNLEDDVLGGGCGIVADDTLASSEFNSSGLTDLEVTGSTLGGHPRGAVYLVGGGAFRFTDNTFEGTDGSSRADTWPRGNGIFATEGVYAWSDFANRGLLLQGNAFSDAGGGAVFLDRSSAALTGNTFQANWVDLWQQRCSGVESPSFTEPLNTELCPTYDKAVEYLTLELVYEEPEIAY